MLIVIDERIPPDAKNHLAKLGKVVEFATQNITYPAISGHPDIFLCQSPRSLICAPNLPEKYFTLFNQENIRFETGEKRVGTEFPDTVFYNCVASEDFLLHKKPFTDSQILAQNKHSEFIEIPQAYARCSLMALPSQIFITSDKGIENALKKRNLNVNYFSPEEIILPGMQHGFIGGALGLNSGKLFVIGNPDFHSWGSSFKALINQQGLELISLYDGPLFDGGGIFFLG